MRSTLRTGVRWTWIGFGLALLAQTAPTVLAEPTGSESGLLQVQLTGMASDEGKLVYAMWNGPDDWLKDNAIQEGAVPIEDGVSVIQFHDLPFGEYAISVFHDVNDNGKLDTGLFRMPKEPLGTSNDAKIRFGPPKYADARFTLEQAEMHISIQVKKLF